jgi:hypothetical protein
MPDQILKLEYGTQPGDLAAAREKALAAWDAAAKGETDPEVLKVAIEMLERAGDFGPARSLKVVLGRLKEKANQGFIPKLDIEPRPSDLTADVQARRARDKAFDEAKDRVVAALNAGDLNAARAALADCDSDTRALAGVTIARREREAR